MQERKDIVCFILANLMSIHIQESFGRFVRSLHPMPEADLQRLWAAFEPREVAKKEFLIREGQFTQDLFFIYLGVFRNFCNKDGKEITLDFHFPPTFYANMIAIKDNAPSILNIQAMEAGTIMVADLRAVEQMGKEHPEIFKLFVRFFERIYSSNQKRQLSFIFDTAEARYRRLFDQRPEVIRKMPLLHIATYLGIKPESLSRIRKKMTDRDKG